MKITDTTAGEYVARAHRNGEHPAHQRDSRPPLTERRASRSGTRRGALRPEAGRIARTTSTDRFFHSFRDSGTVPAGYVLRLLDLS